MGALQAQYAPSGYVGLWTRVAGFKRDALTRALEDRSVIQATLMRTTIDLTSRRDYWKLAMGTQRAQQEWAKRTQLLPPEAKLRSTADALRAALAEDWVGPIDATEDEGLEHLVRTYLRAFGPAPWRDIAQWAGVGIVDARRGAANLALVPYLDERGGELIDLAGLEVIDAATPAPVRFLPHWDANLLVHARRTGVLPEEHRPRIFSTKNPFSVGTYLVDGRVAGGWSLKDGRIVLDPYEEVAARERKAVEREREALEAFHV